jgi:hypothetical protein
MAPDAQSSGMVRLLVWWIALGTALAPAVLLLALTFQCPSMMVGVAESVPGSPAAAPSCAPGLAPQMIVFGPLVAATVAAILWRRTDAALALALLLVGFSFLFGFSMGFLIPLALAVLLAVAAWTLQEPPRDAMPGMLLMAALLAAYAATSAIRTWDFAGLWLAGSLVAALGAWRRDRGILLAAGAVFFLQGLLLAQRHTPLIAPLSLGAAAMCLVASRTLRPAPPTAPATPSPPA